MNENLETLKNRFKENDEIIKLTHDKIWENKEAIEKLQKDKDHFRKKIDEANKQIENKNRENLYLYKDLDNSNEESEKIKSNILEEIIGEK